MRKLKDRLIPRRDGALTTGGERYRENDLALTWLLLFEISKMNVELPESFDYVLGIAFDRASEALREGHLALDYVPHSPQVFEMPEPRHPMYMQALLYWSSKFDCRPAVLAEAYARLGRSAPVASAYLVVSAVRDEHQDRNELRGANTHRREDQPSTLPMFVVTQPV